MKKLMIAGFVFCFAVVSVFFSCSKSGSDDCDQRQKERFGCHGRAPQDSSSYDYLAKGNYKGEKVYFKDISCVSCDVMPPNWGLNCAGDTVRFERFADVTGITTVAVCE